MLITILLLAHALAWSADSYPTRTVRIIVPWPAGGIADVRTRMIAAPLATALGQSVIVENRPGASGTLGASITAKAPPDGYTIMYCGVNELALAPAVRPTLALDPVRDLAPVTLAGIGSMVLVANPGVNITTWRELVGQARAHGSEWTLATAGVATTSHVIGEVLARAIGTRLVPVPYKGAAPALMATIAGESQFTIDFPSTSAPFVDSGQLRALLVLGKRRVPLFPGVPSATEVGLPQLDLPAWGGFCAPMATPPPIIDRLNAEIRKVLAMPAIREVYAKAAAQVVGNTPAEFGVFIRAEQAKWAAIVKSTGIKVE